MIPYSAYVDELKSTKFIFFTHPVSMLTLHPRQVSAKLEVVAHRETNIKIEIKNEPTKGKKKVLAKGVREHNHKGHTTKDENYRLYLL